LPSFAVFLPVSEHEHTSILQNVIFTLRAQIYDM